MGMPVHITKVTIATVSSTKEVYFCDQVWAAQGVLYMNGAVLASKATTVKPQTIRIPVHNITWWTEEPAN